MNIISILKDIKGIKDFDPRAVLKVSCVIMLLVFAIPGGMSIIENSSLGSSNIFNSLVNTLGVNNKSVEKAGFGKVLKVEGNTLTVQGTISTTYKVSAFGTKITRGTGKTAQAISVSDIKPGDNVQIFGTVSNRPITAASIIDTGISLNLFSFPGIGGINRSSTVGSSSGSVSMPSPSNIVDINNLLQGIREK
jgi:hypothetical protein